MSLDPRERLDALRREVLAESPRSTPEGSASPAPTPAAASATDQATTTDRPVTAPAPVPASAPMRPAGSATTATAGRSGGPTVDLGDLDPRTLLADRGLSFWLGVGLLVVGGYLVLSWLVPGVSFLGSLALLAGGLVLMYLHLFRGGAAWMLYAGAVLAGMGSARVVGALLPGEWRGTTAIGVGVAFLAIGYLRHTQAGGYGWQGVIGGAALVLGLVQLVLGWLPGTPGLLDLLSPVALLILGGLLLIAARRADGDRPPRDAT